MRKEKLKERWIGGMKNYNMKIFSVYEQEDMSKYKLGV